LFIYNGGSAAAIVAIAARGQESLVAEDQGLMIRDGVSDGKKKES